MEFVHRRIVRERDEGTAVVLVSTELDEVLGLADRIAVMYRGKIAGEVPAGTSAADVGLLMAGASAEQVQAEAGGAGMTISRRRTTQQHPSPSRSRLARAGLARRLLNAYLYGQTWVVTLLAFVCALIFGAFLIAISDAPTRTASHYFFQHPGDTFSTAWNSISAGYSALFRGAIFNSNSLYSNGGIPVFGPISDTLVNAAPLILGGLAVGVRVPGRAVQHRRPGPADHGRDLRGLRRLRLASAGRHPRARGVGRRRPRRRCLGRDRRLSEGQDRNARSHHDDHVELRCLLLPRLSAGGERFPEAAFQPSDVEQHRFIGAAATSVRRPALRDHPGDPGRRSPAGGCCRARRSGSRSRRSARTRSRRGRPA